MEDDGDDGNEATKGTKKERVGRRKWPDDLWSRVTAGQADHAKIRYELPVLCRFSDKTNQMLEEQET